MNQVNPGSVRLVDVTSDNWRAVAAVRPRPEQERFVAATTYYLCLCHYGGAWQPLAVTVADKIVGYVQWGVDAADGSHWIGGLVLDAAVQGRGLGRATVEALVTRLASDPDCTQISLSYAPDNVVARNLYASLGFVETGEFEGDEITARRPAAQDRATARK